MASVDTAEFCNNGGRVAHFHESDEDGELIATIAYTREDGKIRFGGTIYRPGDTPWTKRAHTETAVSRAVKRPNIIPDGNMNGRERQDYVRASMRQSSLGCRGRRIKIAKVVECEPCD